MNLRVYCPTELSAATQDILATHIGVGNIAVIAGGSKVPPGDLILADVAREAVNEIIDALVALGIQREGGLHVTPIGTWVSERGLKAEADAPGEEADAVVWAEVTAQAYDATAFTWTYATFLTLATVMASIAIILDSPILIVGAMVLGPEFGPIAALGLGIVRRRFSLIKRSLKLLFGGFAIAIATTTIAAYVGKLIGLIPADVVIGSRPGTAFIYHPDKWSIVIAILAGIAGVLSLTSSSANSLVGVFISVTTVPAAGNIALGVVFSQWDQVQGSALQLIVNIIGMAIAGWLTLLLQGYVWQRVAKLKVQP